MSKRDTLFQGFAKLLLDELLSSRCLDLQDGTRFWSETDKAEIEKMIAQRAYDLVYATIEAMPESPQWPTILTDTQEQQQGTCTHSTLIGISPGSMISRSYEFDCAHCGKRVSFSYWETLIRKLCIVAPITEAFGARWEARAEEWCMCKTHKSEVTYQ